MTRTRLIILRNGKIIVGCTAGLRIGDTAKGTRANVDLSRHVLRFLPEKTKKRKNSKALEATVTRVRAPTKPAGLSPPV